MVIADVSTIALKTTMNIAGHQFSNLNQAPDRFRRAHHNAAIPA